MTFKNRMQPENKMKNKKKHKVGQWAQEEGKRGSARQAKWDTLTTDALESVCLITAAETLRDDGMKQQTSQSTPSGHSLCLNVSRHLF